MNDIYQNFTELASRKKKGKDFRIIYKVSSLNWMIMAPHGGRIEPGTSEIAIAIAGGGQFSFYCFEGIKPSNNKILHITSANFDEPKALELASQAEQILTIHCCRVEEEAEILIGGMDEGNKNLAQKILASHDYDAKIATKKLLGTNPLNICNRGKKKMGVQLELRRDFLKQLLKHQSQKSFFVETITSFLKHSNI